MHKEKLKTVSYRGAAGERGWVVMGRCESEVSEPTLQEPGKQA